MGFAHKITWFSFGLYLLVFPGSTFLIALKQIPEWGIGFGAVLMILQGSATLIWLIAGAGKRGALAGILCLLIAWMVEYAGETSGIPFGHYTYTEVLQPQIAGVVPLPIAFAWVTAVVGAWQIASLSQHSTIIVKQNPKLLIGLITATLVLLLDLQIETVATLVHPYWVWDEAGPYYGVPITNFVAWWLIALLMTMILIAILDGQNLHRLQNDQIGQIGSRDSQKKRYIRGIVRRGGAVPHDSSIEYFIFSESLTNRIFQYIPAILYILSTMMFCITNIVYGYWLPALIGIGVLVLLPACSYIWHLTFSPLLPQSRSADGQHG